MHAARSVSTDRELSLFDFFAVRKSILSGYKNISNSRALFLRHGKRVSALPCMENDNRSFVKYTLSLDMALFVIAERQTLRFCMLSVTFIFELVLTPNL